MAIIVKHASNEERLRAALLTVMDAVDYTKQACECTEMVGAVLPKQVIETVKRTLVETALPKKRTKSCH